MTPRDPTAAERETALTWLREQYRGRTVEIRSATLDSLARLLAAARAAGEARGAKARQEMIAEWFCCTGPSGYGLEFSNRVRQFIAPHRCGECKDCKTAAAIRALPLSPPAAEPETKP